jgi:hypothetical protein
MPEILTTAAQPDYLSSEAFQADELELMVDRAERKVLGRYRETDTRSDDLILDEHFGRDVQLEGYVEDDQGDPDLQEMDAGLLDALRAAIAAIVEFEVDRPDEAEHVDSMSQGDRQVSFKDKSLPSSVFSPLRSFDRRSVWH